MASVDLVSPQGTTRTVTELGALQHLVNARGFTVASGTYADAVATLSGWANHPTVTSEAEAIADPATPLGAALRAAFVAVVEYAGNLSAARPAGAKAVYWAGFPATPTNATDNDVVAATSGSEVDAGIRTFDFTPAVGGSTMAFANRMAFHRVRGSGTITKIGLHVITQSGNVGVSAYRNTGVGAAATPGVLLGSSGSVACPAPGYVELALTGGAVPILPGDWLAIWTDNTTASFMAMGSAQDGNAKWAGLHAFQDTATPNPTPAAAGAGLIRGFVLNGVA